MQHPPPRVGEIAWVHVGDGRWVPAQVADPEEFDFDAIRDAFPPQATLALQCLDDENFLLIDPSDPNAWLPFSTADNHPVVQHARADPTLSEAIGMATAIVASSATPAAPQPALGSAAASGATFSKEDRKNIRRYLATLGEDDPNVQIALELLASDGVDTDRLMHHGGRKEKRSRGDPGSADDAGSAAAAGLPRAAGTGADAAHGRRPPQPAPPSVGVSRTGPSGLQHEPTLRLDRPPEAGAVHRGYGTYNSARAALPATSPIPDVEPLVRSPPPGAAAAAAAANDDDEGEEAEYEDEEEGGDTSVTDKDVASARTLHAWRAPRIYERFGVDSAAALRTMSSTAVRTALGLDPSYVPIVVCALYDVDGLGGQADIPLGMKRVQVVCPEALQSYVMTRGSTTNVDEVELFAGTRSGERARVRLVLVPLPRGTRASPTSVTWPQPLSLSDASDTVFQVSLVAAVGTVQLEAPRNVHIPTTRAARWEVARTARCIDISDGVPFGAKQVRLSMFMNNARRFGIANEGLWEGAVAAVLVARRPLDELVATVPLRAPSAVTGQTSAGQLPNSTTTNNGGHGNGGAPSSDDDDDIEAVGGRCVVDCRCPLSLVRLTMPARGVRCGHAQCFELRPWPVGVPLLRRPRVLGRRLRRRALQGVPRRQPRGNVRDARLGIQVFLPLRCDVPFIPCDDV